jgi:hypothetical protein
LEDAIQKENDPTLCYLLGSLAAAGGETAARDLYANKIRDWKVLDVAYEFYAKELVAQGPAIVDRLRELELAPDIEEVEEVCETLAYADYVGYLQVLAAVLGRSLKKHEVDDVIQDISDVSWILCVSEKREARTMAIAPAYRKYFPWWTRGCHLGIRPETIRNLGTTASLLAEFGKARKLFMADLEGGLALGSLQS